MPGFIGMLLNPETIAPILGGGGILGFVGAKFHKLDQEVRECRKRDADVIVILHGVQLVVGKLKRDDPGSVELRMFSDLMNRRLGPPPSIDDMQSLLNQIDEAERKKAARGS